MHGCAAVADNQFVWKDVIRPGVFHVGSKIVTVTPGDITHWHKTFHDMKAAGLSVPAPWSHPSQLSADGKPVKASTPEERSRLMAKLNAGWVVDMRIAPNGVLQGLFDIPNPEDQQRLSTVGSYVSPEIGGFWKDGDGNDWVNAITHCCLTPRPVNRHQSREWNPEAPMQVVSASSMPSQIAMSLDDILQFAYDGDAHPRAPLGGVTIGGKFFPGGKWIPKDQMAKASPSELRNLKAKQAADKEPESTPKADAKKPDDSKGVEVTTASSRDDDAAPEDADKDAQPGDEEIVRSPHTGVAYPAALYSKIKVEPGKGGPIEVTKDDLEYMLDRGVFACISGGPSPHDPEGFGEDDVEKRYTSLRDDLKELGYKFAPIKGKYGGTEEDSYMVFIPEAKLKAIVALGEKYNQDSIVFSDRGVNHLVYTTGENKGQEHVGTGWEKRSETDDDFWSEAGYEENGKKKTFRFLLNLDFDKKRKYTHMGLPTKADDEQPDGDDKPDDESLNEKPADGQPGAGEDSGKARLTMLIQSLADCGIIVPESISLSGDVDVLLAAVMTYKQKETSKDDDDGSSNPDKEGQEESSGIVNMSLDPRVTALADRLAKAEQQNLTTKINAYVMAGKCSPGMADVLKATVGRYQFSADGTPSDAEKELATQFGMLDLIPDGTFSLDKEQIKQLSLEEQSTFFTNKQPGEPLSEEETLKLVNLVLRVPAATA